MLCDLYFSEFLGGTAIKLRMFHSFMQLNSTQWLRIFCLYYMEHILFWSAFSRWFILCFSSGNNLFSQSFDLFQLFWLLPWRNDHVILVLGSLLSLLSSLTVLSFIYKFPPSDPSNGLSEYILHIIISLFP